MQRICVLVHTCTLTMYSLLLVTHVNVLPPCCYLSLTDLGPQAQGSPTREASQPSATVSLLVLVRTTLGTSSLQRVRRYATATCIANRDDSIVHTCTSQAPALGTTSQPPPQKKSEVSDLFDEGAAGEDMFSTMVPGVYVCGHYMCFI